MNRPAPLPDTDPHGTQTGPLPAESAAPASPVLSSHAVLQGRSHVAIEHNGAVYRLQTTRQGKLILTK